MARERLHRARLRCDDDRRRDRARDRLRVRDVVDRRGELRPARGDADVATATTGDARRGQHGAHPPRPLVQPGQPARARGLLPDGSLGGDAPRVHRRSERSRRWPDHRGRHRAQRRRLRIAGSGRHPAGDDETGARPARRRDPRGRPRPRARAQLRHRRRAVADRSRGQRGAGVHDGEPGGARGDDVLRRGAGRPRRAQRRSNGRRRRVRARARADVRAGRHRRLRRDARAPAPAARRALPLLLLR